jgi:ubiquinone/menaquinone biosynthesis C-methylase UbiE
MDSPSADGEYALPSRALSEIVRVLKPRRRFVMLNTLPGRMLDWEIYGRFLEARA